MSFWSLGGVQDVAICTEDIAVYKQNIAVYPPKTDTGHGNALLYVGIVLIGLGIVLYATSGNGEDD